MIITLVSIIALQSCLGSSPAQYSVPVPNVQGHDSRDMMSKMVLIRGGCFQMGDIFGDGYIDEKPIHEVCVDDFYLGKFEVTQREWEEVMGKNISSFKQCGKDCPAEEISWDDADEYIRKLNQKTGREYRLPTEAEWEYACRSGGKREKYSGGKDLDSVAWYISNSGHRTHPVGQKYPNGLGIYDMNGNVWEWVSDKWDRNYYKNSPKNDPKGPDNGSNHVRRGGSWDDFPMSIRCSVRDEGKSDRRGITLGFRLAITPLSPPSNVNH